MDQKAAMPVLVSKDDRLTVLSLNAPERVNAISTEMRLALREALVAAFADPDCRAIVLTGEGGVFSSGADIGQMQSGGGVNIAHVRMRYKILHDAVKLIVEGCKPVVSAVEGYAYGAGLSVAVSADYVVVSETAKFGAAFGRMGLVGDCGLLWNLPKRIGMARTKDFMFGMRTLSGREAVTIGMADEIAPPGQALAAAKAKALAYCQGAPLSVATTKVLMARNYASIGEFLEVEGEAQESLVLSADHDEGRRAFAEKRAPHFQGR